MFLFFSNYSIFYIINISFDLKLYKYYSYYFSLFDFAIFIVFYFIYFLVDIN